MALPTHYKDIQVSVSRCGKIYSIGLNQPKKMNAISFDTILEIQHFIETVVNPFSSDARVVVLYGVGKNFTAGLDLKSKSAQMIMNSFNSADDLDPARQGLRIN